MRHNSMHRTLTNIVARPRIPKLKMSKVTKPSQLRHLLRSNLLRISQLRSNHLRRHLPKRRNKKINLPRRSNKKRRPQPKKSNQPSSRINPLSNLPTSRFRIILLRTQRKVTNRAMKNRMLTNL